MTHRFIQNHALALAALAAALALAALGFGLIRRLHVTEQFRHQTAQNCMQLEKLKAGISLVFQDTLDSVEEQRPFLKPAQYTAAHAFYQRQLDRFAPTGCPSP